MAANNLFLLGAGFDRALWGDGIPLNNELLENLTKGQEFAPLNRSLEKHGNPKDIEIYLSRLDLEIAGQSETEEMPVGRNEAEMLRLYMDNAMAAYFARFRFKETLVSGKGWIEGLKTSFARNDVIVNLNYSCLMDGLLDYFGIWSPKGGYGNYFKNSLLDTCNDVVENETLNGIFHLKIHGSEHFRRNPFIDNPSYVGIDFHVSEEIFPKTGKNRNFGLAMDQGSYIIAPSFIKIWHVQLTSMLLQAIATAREARKFVVIGCSLRPEDAYLWTLIFNFFIPTPAGKKMILLSPSADKLKERVLTYFQWAGKHLETQIISIPQRLENGLKELELHLK